MPPFLIAGGTQIFLTFGAISFGGGPSLDSGNFLVLVAQAARKIQIEILSQYIRSIGKVLSVIIYEI